jgi:polysaccharide export outer membrane protein
MRSFCGICLLTFVGILSVCFPTHGQSDPPSVKVADTTGIASPAQDERYRIGFQDTLAIQIFRHPELTQRVNVNPNGTINLFKIEEPLIAVCKTERELAVDIAEAYKKDYLRNPEVQVTAVEQKSQAFGVVGAVEKPGYYYITRRIRLLELLALAGGPNKEAGTRITVARAGSTSDCKADAATSASNDLQTIDFKLKDVLEGKSGIQMNPGDVMAVMPADVVYMYGNVNKQGQVKLTGPMTLTQAIVSAEGLKPATKKDSVRIIRQKTGTFEREEMIFNLNEIDKRKVNDPFLEPNDIVAISEDKTRSILNAIKNGVTQGIPSLFYRVP